MAILPFKITCISFCVFFFFYFITTPVISSNNETDFRALLAFKKAIDTNPYESLSSWNETVHFCSWQGILCSQRHQNRIVSINLMSQGLFGTLSPHLGNLSFLKSIDLKNNSFYGQIPDQIGRLRRLQLVDFSSNSLSGEIPRNLSQCTNINSLNLIDNNLTGPIIPELGSLSRLERLGLRRNQFSGTIPSSFGNLTNLIVLSLRNCGVQGDIPDSLVQLQSLRFLILDDNHLTGRIPSGMYNISTISFFLMRSNQLQGTIPSEIIFPNLRYIDLRDNLFHGVIPLSLSNFSMLEEIELSTNNFSGPITIDFSRLSALQHLILQSNSFVGDLSFISSMANCTSLTLLSLADNLLSGSLPVSIGNLSNQLNFIYLGGNMLQGNIPSSIGNLGGLALLTMDHNNLEGPIPSSIGKLNNLQVLYIGDNRLSSQIPFSLGNLTLLNHLHLQENDLSGNIPISLSNFTSLISLDISLNNLNGSIPLEFMRSATTLVSLDISNNAIIGSIPLEVGSLINLENLILNDNKLSGPIPNTLSRCTKLERIQMEKNSLNGELPDGLRSLRGVQYLDLSSNNLTGSIPRYLGEMDFDYLNLSFNRLQGEVPALGVFLNKSVVSLEGNDGLCGVIPYLNLPPCSSTSSKKKRMSTLSKILVSVAAGAMCISLMACFYVLKYRKRVSKNTRSSVPSFEANILRLSYGELLKATDGFSEANLLGAGRYGSVYKGIVSDWQVPLAVKVLNLNTKGASKSFVSECNVLRGIRHRNLVKLVSVCSSTDFQGNDFKALVYEFKANGNLDEWLHQELEETMRNISLRQRLNIAIDIASALSYLHCGTDSIIVHGDVKPSNVLLDEEMNAYVADFGLAKIVSNTYSTQESSSTGIKGTIGYIAPEYGMSSTVSIEGDVYSYGIVLLEMFTGRRPTDGDSFVGYSSLRDLVQSSLPSQVMEIVDPIILNDHEQKVDGAVWRCVVCVLEIGVACSKDLPRDRMEMSDVVTGLYKSVHMIE